MTNLAPSSAAFSCAPAPARVPVLEALPGRVTELDGLWAATVSFPGPSTTSAPADESWSSPREPRRRPFS